MRADLLDHFRYAGAMGVLRQFPLLLIVFAISGFGLPAMIGRSAGQEISGGRAVGADSTITQSAGQDAGGVTSLSDSLRSQVERSEKAVQATADSVRVYADLLRKQAELSEQSTKHELDTIERSLGKFVSVIQGIGWALGVIAVALGVVLAFFGVGTMGDIRRRAEATFKEKMDELTEAARKTVDDQVKNMEKELRIEFDKSRGEFGGLRSDLQKRADEINARFSSIDDDLTKLTSDLVSRRDALAQTRTGIAQPEPDYKGKSIIWVDDQPNTTLTAREELARYGITATPVNDTLALEEMLARPPDGKQFDLIVSDMRRGPNPRAGLDYFKTIAGKDLPKRLIFAPNSLVRPVENEIRELQNEDGSFLGAVTGKEPFFAKVFEALRSA